MKRRQVLRSIGAASAGLASSGLAGADKSDKPPAQIDSSRPEIVDYRRIRKGEIERLKPKIQSDNRVKKLISQVNNLGWSPDWSSLRGKRYTVVTGIVRGKYDVAAVKFGKRSENQSTDPESVEEVDEEEVVLRWTGNNKVETREKRDADTVGTISVQEAIEGTTNQVAIFHSKKKSESNLNYSITGPIADEITAYVVKSAISENKNLRSEINENVKYQQSAVNSDKNGVVSMTVTTKPENTRKSKSTHYRSAGSGDSDCGEHPDEICEPRDVCPDVPIEVVQGKKGCYDLVCLVLAGGGSVSTVLGCIASSGIACLLGLGVGSVSVVECNHCNTVAEVKVDVKTSWLENYYAEHPNLNVGNACLYSKRGDDDIRIPVTKCELENMPTKEEYNYAEC